MKVGDPRDAATMVGPMISEAEARRAEEWIAEAVARARASSTAAAGTARCSSRPFSSARERHMKVMCEEVFAPVLSVIPFRVARGGRRRGQQRAVRAGGRRVHTATSTAPCSPRAALHVGIVHINEPSSSRVDLIPFAGVKDSGLGREGPKYAMQEMTEERLITLSLENPR